ncbi:MAG: LapA family protein [Candidatus Moraniibacteriota bacterium]
MKIFIVIVLVIMGLTFFVTSNTGPVPLHFFTLTREVPLSFILVFPIGIALLVFAIYHVRQRSKANFIIRDLEDSLESEQEKVLEIVKRTHELEIENQKLKIRLGGTTFDDDSL